MRVLFGNVAVAGLSSHAQQGRTLVTVCLPLFLYGARLIPSPVKQVVVLVLSANAFNGQWSLLSAQEKLQRRAGSHDK